MKKQLGKSLSTEELAEYLGVDTDYVRKHYKFFGGIRPSARGRVLFFENLTVEAIRRASNAIEDQETREDTLVSQNSEGWPNQAENLQYQDGSTHMGNRTADRRLEDPHGLLDTD